MNEELSDIVFSESKQNSYNLWVPRFGNRHKEDNILKLMKANNYEIRVTLFLLSCRKSIEDAKSYLELSFYNQIIKG